MFSLFTTLRVFDDWHQRYGWRWPYRNFAKTCGIRKLDIVRCYLCNDTSSRFDRISAYDGQTTRRTASHIGGASMTSRGKKCIVCFEPLYTTIPGYARLAHFYVMLHQSVIALENITFRLHHSQLHAGCSDGPIRHRTFLAWQLVRNCSTMTSTSDRQLHSTAACTDSVKVSTATGSINRQTILKHGTDRQRNESATTYTCSNRDAATESRIILYDSARPEI